MKYNFPAVFHAEAEGGYSISFPDVPGCYSQGETVQECCEMAEDALNLMLWEMEENNQPIPAPAPIKDIQSRYPDDIVTLVKADTLAYRELYDTKAVKKTLSIPRWLDTLAQERRINFSNVLQQALMKELDVSPHYRAAGQRKVSVSP